MTAVRFIASLLLLAALVSFVYDATRPLPDGAERTSSTLARHWSAIAPASFAAARRSVERSTSTYLWDPVILGVIERPAWIVLGGLGGLLAVAGRRRRRVNVFVN